MVAKCAPATKSNYRVQIELQSAILKHKVIFFLKSSTKLVANLFILIEKKFIFVNSNYNKEEKVLT
jgi:hypothetical protein